MENIVIIAAPLSGKTTAHKTFPEIVDIETYCKVRTPSIRELPYDIRCLIYRQEVDMLLEDRKYDHIFVPVSLASYYATAPIIAPTEEEALARMMIRGGISKTLLTRIYRQLEYYPNRIYWLKNNEYISDLVKTGNIKKI